ncbi:MAG TPA: NAD(P)-dependent oxidoreductase [Acidimicrobiales bacterium]|jgi:D-3-phosphoglycerate dehydrogenase
MTRHRALVTAPFGGKGLEHLQTVMDVVLDPWIDHRPMRVLDGDGLLALVRHHQADVVIAEADFVMGSIIDEGGLWAIGSTRGDPTNVDVAGATAKGIPVLHTPGRNADAVAEITVALLLAAARRIIPADRDLRASQVFRDGTVPYQRFRGREINGRTAGLVGFGAIGRAVAWRLEGLGMRVLSFDPFASDASHTDLHQMLRECDVVSMHAAITPDTMHMMGATEFAVMRDDAIFVNAARAGLADLDALTAALVDGKLAAAAIDHFDGEQLAPGHPLIGMDNVVLTPHIGGATYETEMNHSRMIANDLAALAAGRRPEHIVNPDVLDA